MGRLLNREIVSSVASKVRSGVSQESYLRARSIYLHLLTPKAKSADQYDRWIHDERALISSPRLLVRLIHKALSEFPNDATYTFSWIEQLVQLNGFDGRAESIAEEYFRLNSSPETTKQQVQLYRALGKHQEALALAQDLLLKHPEDVALLRLSADLAYECKDTVSARRYHETLVRLDNSDFRAHLDLARIYASEGRWKEATQFFRTAYESSSKQNPSDQFSVLDYVWWVKSERNIGGRGREAMVLLKALSVYPLDQENTFGWLCRLAEIDVLDEEHIEIASRYFETYKDESVLLDYARFFISQKRFQKAFQLMAPYCEHNPHDPEIRNLLATVYIGLGDLSHAKHHLAISVEHGAINAETYVCLAEAYLKEEDVSQALEYYQKAIESGANRAEVYDRWIQIQLMQGVEGDAIHALRIALDTFPADPIYSRDWLLRLVSFVGYSSEIQTMARALFPVSQDTHSRYRYAEFLCDAQAYTEAIAFIGPLVSAEEEVSVFDYLLGKSYLELGDIKRAKESLQSAIDNRIELARCHACLGRIAYENDEVLTARSHYTTAVEHKLLDPELYDQWIRVELRIGDTSSLAGALRHALSVYPLDGEFTCKWLKMLHTMELFDVDWAEEIAESYSRYYTSGEPRYRYIDLLRHLGNTHEALRLAKYSLEQDGGNSSLLFEVLAKISQDQQDYESSRDYIDRAIALSNDSSQYNSTIARTYFLGGDYVQAIEYFLRAFKANAIDLETFHKWIDAEQRVGTSDSIVDVINTGLEYFPFPHQYLSSWLRSYRRHEELSDSTIASFEHYFSQEDPFTNRLKYADLLLSIGLHSHTIAIVKTLLEQSPQSYQALRTITYAYLGLNDFKSAIHFATQAAEYDPKKERGTLTLAQCYFRGGYYQEARSFYREVFSSGDLSCPTQVHRWVLSEIQCGDKTDAVSALSRALEQYPFNAQYTYRWFRQLAMLDGFESVHDKALQRYFSKFDSIEFKARYCDILCELGRHHQALDAAYAAIEEYGESLEILRTLGCIFLSENKLIEARQYFFKALHHDPDKQVGLAYIARVYFREGDYVQAREYFKSAIALSHNDPRDCYKRVLCEFQCSGESESRFGAAREFIQRFPAERGHCLALLGMLFVVVYLMTGLVMF